MKFHVFRSWPSALEDQLNSLSKDWKIVDVNIFSEMSGNMYVLVMYEEMCEILRGPEASIEIGKLKQENQELMEALGTVRKVNDDLDNKIKELEKSITVIIEEVGKLKWYIS